MSADWAHQQVFPITALGTEHAAVRYRDRVAGQNENPPWRIVGVVDGTNLTYSPKRPSAAPEVINKGDVVTFRFKGWPSGGLGDAGAPDSDASTPELEEPYPFVVRSQDKDHPFYFWAYMTGSENAFGLGPEWVAVVPTEQYPRSALFFTNRTYPDTSLVVVRKQVDGAFKEVTLGCAGPLADWRPIDSEGTLQYTLVTIVTGNVASQNGCVNGRQFMESDGSFGATVWGWGALGGYTATSYAIPVGMASQHRHCSYHSLEQSS